MLRSTNLCRNSLNKVVENDNLVVGGGNSSQILAELKKSNYHPKMSKFKKTNLDKSEILAVAINAGTTGYLTAKARVAFTCLKKAFTKISILRHFDLECHIWVKTDASGYAIGEVLSQLNSDWVDCSNSTKFDFNQ